ncbi:DUF6550 family protein [Paenibacillus ehimensis]|uniref:DUF6550 family protein n=1 Tax=Paenibacillus ehimensis TaxID=79264 RepID=UPI001267A548|nr:DUF6550 family protein [Paenibacillus ehimensis]
MKRKAWGLISGLLVAGIGAFWILWPTSSMEEAPPEKSTNTPSTTSSDVAITNIQASPSSTPPPSSSSPSEVAVPNIKQQPPISDEPVLQPEKEKKHVEVPITKPEKTTPPKEPPKPKVKEPEKKQSPSSPPVYEEKETEPNKQASQPKVGDKNSKGQVYFPGFGWVEDQGGGSQGTSVGNKGDQLTGNKVGSMD